MNALGKSIYQCLWDLFDSVVYYSNRIRILLHAIVLPVLCLKVKFSSKFQKPQAVQAEFCSPLLSFEIVFV